MLTSPRGVSQRNDTANTAFALVRNPEGATRLATLQNARPNVYVVKADITDVASLRVCSLS